MPRNAHRYGYPDSDGNDPMALSPVRVKALWSSKSSTTTVLAEAMDITYRASCKERQSREISRAVQGNAVIRIGSRWRRILCIMAESHIKAPSAVALGAFL